MSALQCKYISNPRSSYNSASWHCMIWYCMWVLVVEWWVSKLLYSWVLTASVVVCVIQWLEMMQVVYSSKAQEAGVYVCVCVGRVRLCVCVCVCVCGWTQWLEKMQVVYSSKAQEAGVYVLEACGFDSIPAEMALLHATKQFDGRCHCLTHTWLLFVYSILFTLLPQKHRKKQVYC